VSVPDEFEKIGKLSKGTSDDCRSSLHGIRKEQSYFGRDYFVPNRMKCPVKLGVQGTKMGKRKGY